MKSETDKKKTPVWSKVLKIIINAILIVSGIVLIAISALSITSYIFPGGKVKIFGYTNAVVLSGSMEPSINVGDMLFVKKQGSYQVGDIVAFIPKERNIWVTHRIIAEDNEGFQTKGDNNNSADLNKVNKDDIIGRVVFHIPKVGDIRAFFASSYGITLVIFLVGGVVLLEVLRAIKKKN